MSCPIQPGLRYHKATPVFHQWRDGQRQEVCLFVCLFNTPPRRVWGLAFSAAEQADTFAFSLQGALEALALEEERKRRRKEEQVLIKEETRETSNEEEQIRAKDGQGGWSPRRER